MSLTKAISNLDDFTNRQDRELQTNYGGKLALMVTISGAVGALVAEFFLTLPVSTAILFSGATVLAFATALNAAHLVIPRKIAGRDLIVAGIGYALAPLGGWATCLMAGAAITAPQAAALLLSNVALLTLHHKLK